MELWQEMTRELILTGEISLQLSRAYADVLESRCYLALERIREIVRNEDLSDAECFMRIEEIVTVLEDMGSNGGFRHDFG